VWRRWFTVAAGAALVVGTAAAAGVAPAAAVAQEVRQGGRQAAQVTGRVESEDGRPLAHAQVHVPALGRGTLADGAGRFVLGELPPGRHVVHVAHVGYAPVRREVVVERGGVAELVVTLVATPLSLPGIQVTGRTGGDDPLAAVQATTQLAGRELERELGGTIARTLARQAGIAVRTMGPAAALPVMRGLTGDRILVLQDGQRSGDLAGSADDHGMTIDPLAAQRVEVVRGPATLLYGNNALGGVVNVISSDIPGWLPRRGEYAAALQSETAYPGGTASVRAAVPVSGRWAVGARAGARRTADMRIPAGPELGRRLANSGRRDWNGSLGVGYAGLGRSGGVAARAYDFAYGLPVPPGGDPVSLRGRRVEGTGRAELHLASPLLPSLRLDGTVQDYRHDELDDADGAVLQRFGLATRTANLLARQGALGPATGGAWGVSGLFKRYTATGPEALTPPADSRGLGAFGFQEIGLGAGAGGPALEVGGRFDAYRIQAHASEKFGPARTRTFRALSGSVGLRLPLAPSASAGVSLTRSFRAPTVEELHSGAAHAGTGAVEFGNPALAAERGTSGEVVLRGQQPRWQAQIAAYHSAIDDFVHLAARGDTVLGGVTLPVLEYAATRAVLRGAEGSVEWAPVPEIVLSAVGDYIHAADGYGTPLSFMPPARLGFGARWERGPFGAGGDVDRAFRQRRVGPADERPTPGSVLLRLHAALRFDAAGRGHTLALRAENLAGVTHREATSRIKDFAPGPGRNLALLYRVHW
jgi:iron complex outermembrane recepter protein